MKTAPSTSQAHKIRWPVCCWHEGMTRIERPRPRYEPKKDSSLGQTAQMLQTLQLFASGMTLEGEPAFALSAHPEGERVSHSVMSNSLQPHGPSVHGILQVSVLE